ncbi:MAG: hypothetical protein ABI557_01640, partial [Aureliella sp.]
NALKAQQSGEFNQREWTSTAATIEGDHIIAKALPADTTAWFVTAKDDRGAVVSSRVEFAR